jgi:hypothetical protein
MARRNLSPRAAFGAIVVSFLSGPVCADDLLDGLLADYREYGLPLPPQDARLALHTSPDFGSGNHVRLLFFEVRAPTKERPGVCLGGLGTHELTSHAEITSVAAAPDLLPRIETHVPFLFGCDFQSPAYQKGGESCWLTDNEEETREGRSDTWAISSCWVCASLRMDVETG